jgi:hypothetical protein
MLNNFLKIQFLFLNDWNIKLKNGLLPISGYIMKKEESIALPFKIQL